MSSTIRRSSFENCLFSSGANRFFSKIDHGCRVLDDGIFKIGQQGANLVEQISRIGGDSQTAQKCNSAASAFGASRDAIGATRFVFSLHKIPTGQMFWQTAEQTLEGETKDQLGWRRVKYKNGEAVRIPKEELDYKWQQRADGTWRNGDLSSADGKYIDTTGGEWGFIERDWMDIAMDILMVFARLIAPVRWLHYLKASHLDARAAKCLGGITMGLWASVLSIGLFQSIRDLSHAVDMQVIQKKVWEVFQAVIDLIGLPFEFGLGASHPILAAIGAGINILSAITFLAREIIFYS